MLFIFVSYWAGVFLVAGAVGASNPTDNPLIGVVIVGLGAIVQSIVLLLRKLL